MTVLGVRVPTIVLPKFTGVIDGLKLRAEALKPQADYWLSGLLVILAGVMTVLNIAGYPRWFSDEGVYVAQAWAVKTQGVLANYTYWYDHPPLGWIQIAIWTAITGGMHRYAGDITLAGREFMVFVRLVSVVMVYVLARRLQFRRTFAFSAGLLYVVSPLAVGFSRYALLDNIAMAWLLAAMVLMLSPNRKLTAVLGGSLCLAVAVLSKETVALAALAMPYLVWWHYRRAANRTDVWIIFGSVTVLVGLMYPLYAILKGELVPGPGHVSLGGALQWQLSARAGSGSLLDPNSDARHLVDNAWLGLDKWLPFAGIAAVIPGLFIKRLRVLSIALGVQVGMLFRGGYLPYPYIIAMLPFMALLVAGVADVLWPSIRQLRCKDWEGWRRVVRRTVAVAGACLVVAMVIPFALYGAPAWQSKLAYVFTAQETTSQQEVIDWVGQNLPKDSRLVTDGELWLDIRNAGFDNPQVIWTYKVDTDPAVRREFGSAKDIDYLVMSQQTLDSSDQSIYQTVFEAAKGAKTIATFGSREQKIVVMQVNPTR